MTARHGTEQNAGGRQARRPAARRLVAFFALVLLMLAVTFVPAVRGYADSERPGQAVESSLATAAPQAASGTDVAGTDATTVTTGNNANAGGAAANTEAAGTDAGTGETVADVATGSQAVDSTSTQGAQPEAAAGDGAASDQAVTDTTPSDAATTDTASDQQASTDNAASPQQASTDNAATTDDDSATEPQADAATDQPASSTDTASEATDAEAESLTAEEVSEELATAGGSTYTPHVAYRAHVQMVGWQDWIEDGKTAGTSGKGYRVEALNIKLEGAPKGSSIRYRMHVQNIGWQDWVADGKLGGTSGKGLRVEAMQLKLEGAIAADYDLYYRVHAQNYGWLSWVKNGVSAGTEGMGLRLEAIEIRLVRKGEAAPGDTTPLLVYRGHVQNIGWQDWVTPAKTAGTSGRGLRVEALQSRVMNADGGIRAMAHVQNIGWQDWTKNGGVAGTSGKGLRVEAIKLELTGNIAKEYDLYYRVHAQNIGWLAWAKNGQQAGSEGFAYRLEAMQLQLVKKGGAAPKNDGVSYAFLGPGTIEYRAKQKGTDWSAWKKNGESAGATGKALLVESIALRIPADVNQVPGGVTYRAHVQNEGWTGWLKDGAAAGTAGSGRRVEAFQIKLTGEMAKLYDVYYRAHVQDLGWMGWTKNGASAGTSGMGVRIESYQIKIVAKGAAAPGSTTRPFLDGSVRKTGYQNPAGFYQVSANTVVLTPAAYSTPHCYVTPSRIAEDASRQDCIDAFLGRAREYIGTPYVWDYSRQPGVGVDCIGLVYQCAYATGMDMGRGGPDDKNAFNPYAHWYSGSSGWHSHDANNFWDYGKAKHVPLSDRQPGDLISWPGHIGIYIGDDQIIDAYPGYGVAQVSMWSHGTPRGCIRLYQ